jgi:hypothetical protein
LRNKENKMCDNLEPLSEVMEHVLIANVNRKATIVNSHKKTKDKNQPSRIVQDKVWTNRNTCTCWIVRIWSFINKKYQSGKKFQRRKNISTVFYQAPISSVLPLHYNSNIGKKVVPENIDTVWNWSSTDTCILYL